MEEFASRDKVAQLVEQWTENPRVGSSILPEATIPRNLQHLETAERSVRRSAGNFDVVTQQFA